MNICKTKWKHYSKVYERHLLKLFDKPNVIWEIGIWHGDSLRMLKNLFKNSKIIGIDIDIQYYFEEAGFSIHIGDQSDVEFLKKVVQAHGVPNIVIDDGSHHQKDMITTFNTIYPLMKRQSVYIVEDTRLCYSPQYGGGLGHPDSFIELCKNNVDEINIHGNKNKLNNITDSDSVCFYDSIVVLEKMINRKLFV